jgi:hypothetical protein
VCPQHDPRQHQACSMIEHFFRRRSSARNTERVIEYERTLRALTGGPRRYRADREEGHRDRNVPCVRRKDYPRWPLKN